jgi:stage III sporulation protein AH
MTKRAEQESAAESLLASKGFTNSVVTLSEDSADVLVGKSELTDAELAQIEDVITRKTDTPAENIVISPISSTSASQDSDQQ